MQKLLSFSLSSLHLEVQKEQKFVNVCQITSLILPDISISFALLNISANMIGFDVSFKLTCFTDDEVTQNT